MRNISAWAIRHPTLPIVLFVVLAFVGIVSFIRLPINLNPDVSFPLVSVSVTQPGAAPSEIETQVTQKIEAAVASIGDVRSLTSRAIEGYTNLMIEFQIGTPIDRAVSDVRDAISKVRADLPEGIQEPLVQRIDVDGGAIAYYAVTTSTQTPEQLSWFIDDTISRRLASIAGVAQVSRTGGVDREIRVELDPARMQALGITAVEVNQQIRQLNLDVAGGRAQVGGGEQAIRVLGGARSAEALGDTQMALPGGRLVRLRDIADVRDSVGEIRSMSRLNGRLSTSFGVFRARGYSDVSVLDAVEAELEKIRAETPGVEISRVFTTVDNTRRSYRAALIAMFEGSVLAVLVVFLFLRDFRATAISALAIPLSAIPTFAFMQSMGFTLNSISLLALSLVAGVLVDDAIVEIENIVRHMRMGKSGYRAAIEAADEIGLAVVATSATIIAVFLPVSFMGGFTGQYFKQFGLTVAAAVFFSLLVARLITPLVAAYTLRPHEQIRSADGPLMTRYLEMLRWCLEHRKTTLLAGITFLLVSMGLFVVIPKSFVPDGDFSTSQLTIELPPGVRLEETARIASIAAGIVSKYSEVSNVVESIGGGEDGEVRKATLYITLVPREQRELTQKQWEKLVTPELAAVPDARVSFIGGQGGGGRPITLYLTGSDSAALQKAAEDAVAQMQGLAELSDPRIDGDLQRPEIVVRPRLDLAAELGVSVASIGQTIRIATIGDIPQNAAKFSLSDRQIPIRVSLVEGSRRDFATLENLPVPTAAGDTVPLKAVADIVFAQGPSTIRRYGQQRRLMITSDLNGVELGSAMARVYALPALRELPEGVRLVEKGDAEFMKELFDNFLLAMAAGVLMVFAVLVLLFQRVFQPITILSALPLSIGGAILALMLLGKPFSMPVVIGFLMLMGIVGKNSILLVDFAIEEIRAGRSRTEALLEAGHKRARPIVMTTVAMVAGMLPAALGTGGDSGFRAPMGVAVIGGLITSTLLTLVIVPAFFTLIDDLERWFAPRIAARVNLADREEVRPAGPEARPAG
ncbi:MAG: efflux RND transporter permease subunit [Gammaproteobacteria bacterium]|nr:efflux RND transporter permease subunit [Gammaproteobacteria bacterium]